MSPREALEAIDALEKFGIHLGLDRVSACLSSLGNPQNRFPSVHVGGTNGKGSTSYLIATVLSESGYRTGLFTSPPLESFGERIQVDGSLLTEGVVPDLWKRVRAAWEENPAARGMTQFEAITCMAFQHFARVDVDAAVVEVGLGGRLDATNVVRPEVVVVTNVGLEHAEYLGDTTADIAREKAGIIKPGAALVTAAEGEAFTVLERAARRVGSATYRLGRDFFVEPEGSETCRFEGRRWRLTDLKLGLLGGFQRLNLAVALAALEVLEERRWNVDRAGLYRGVARARWPGRLELLGDGPRVLLDGAHNPHAAKALAEALAHDLTYERLFLILGILGDKDASSILAALMPLADRGIVTRSTSSRSMSTSEIERLAMHWPECKVDSVPTAAAALDAALSEAGPRDLICVTGSLTTVGDARAHLRSLRWVS